MPDKVQFRCIVAHGPWNVGRLTAVDPGPRAQRLLDSKCWEIYDAKKDKALAEELAAAGLNADLSARVVRRGYTVELLRRQSLRDLQTVFSADDALEIRKWQESRGRVKSEPAKKTKQDAGPKGGAKA